MAPALVESMFSVREVPWHGLGKIVQEAPTSIEAIRMAGLDWKVEPKSIYDEKGNQIPNWVANTRDSDNSVLGLVTEKYKIVQNSEAFEFTDNLLGEGVTYETAGSLNNGKTVWLLAKLEGKQILGDKVDPYLCFTNNHQGTGAVRVCMTPIRVVCNNTLNLALSSASRMWSTRHMGDIQSKLAEAKHTLQLADNYMTKLDEYADVLANKKVSDAELEKIFDIMYPIDYQKDSNRKITNILDMKSEFFRCLMMPDISQFRNTAWGAIMAATDQADHSAPGRLTEAYAENRFGKILSGHPYVDKWVEAINRF